MADGARPVAEVIELGPVDRVAAGAVGPPGRRLFLVQGVRGDRTVTVLLEKQQVAMLAQGVLQLLDRLQERYPEEPAAIEAASRAEVAIEEPSSPLFRVRQLGIGFDPAAEMILLELQEWPDDEEVEGAPDPEERRILRLRATRAQARTMAVRGLEAVQAGRPVCPLCQLPRDPDGHRCPSVN